MNNEEIIPMVKFGCNTYIFSLPLAFDESLSYLEQQCAILNKLNETIAQVNKNTTTIESIDINFDTLYKDMADLQAEMVKFENDTNAYIESKFSQLWNQVLSIMNDYQASFELELNTKIGQVNARIDAIEIGDISVYNPTTGRVENINKVLTDIYDSVRYDAITCSEFDALEYTATGFDAVEITAFNFDNNGKSILENA